MKKFIYSFLNNTIPAIYSFLNNTIPALLFSFSTIVSSHNTVYGVILYVISFMSLDLHSYIDKELNYPNNIFIKN